MPRRARFGALSGGAVSCSAPTTPFALAVDFCGFPRVPGPDGSGGLLWRRLDGVPALPDDSADSATRLAAVQLCETLHLASALPFLRTLSADDSANTALRLAARHSLSAIESATMPPD